MTPYPPGQLQEVAVDVHHSFFPGFALLDNELIRLDLVPPQLENVPNPQAEVDAGPDQEGGVVAAVGHQGFGDNVGVRPSEGEVYAFTSPFAIYLRYGRESMSSPMQFRERRLAESFNFKLCSFMQVLSRARTMQVLVQKFVPE